MCHRGEEDAHKCSGIASEFVSCVGQVCVCVIGVRRMARSVAGVASESVTCVGQVRVCHRG